MAIVCHNGPDVLVIFQALVLVNMLGWSIFYFLPFTT